VKRNPEAIDGFGSKVDFFRRVRALSYIERCSNTPHIREYSVAEHSFYIALYSLVFADLENERSREEKGYEIYNLQDVMEKSLLHDLEESITGDVLFTMHRLDLKFKSALDDVREHCVEKYLFKEFSGKFQEKYCATWRLAKDSTPEGTLVACMDKFEILIFAMQEIIMGNNHFWKMYKNARDIILNDFDIKSVAEVVLEINCFLRDFQVERREV
jgi:5'-deoxynucleotidase YfbR-like HD superfamily hydrolase